MTFARVETQRLLDLAHNQAGILAELYQRLQDALPGDAQVELAGGDGVCRRIILPARPSPAARASTSAGELLLISLRRDLIRICLR